MMVGHYRWALLLPSKRQGYHSPAFGHQKAASWMRCWAQKCVELVKSWALRSIETLIMQNLRMLLEVNDQPTVGSLFLLRIETSAGSWRTLSVSPRWGSNSYLLVVPQMLWHAMELPPRRLIK